MAQQFYTQCRLERQKEEGIEVTFSWIPKKYAVKGKILRLKDVDGWRVTNTWETMPEEYVRNRANYHKHWRIKTDI